MLGQNILCVQDDRKWLKAVRTALLRILENENNLETIIIPEAYCASIYQPLKKKYHTNKTDTYHHPVLSSSISC